MIKPVDVAGVHADSAADNSAHAAMQQLRIRHWIVLLLAIAVIAAAFCLQFNERDAPRLTWFGSEMPATCASRLLLGVECPGCGLTRSFVALAGGDFAASFHYNRVGWVVALAVVVQVPYRVFALWELRKRVAERPWLGWLGYSLIAAVVINWCFRMWGI